MQIPLEITYRELAPSEALNAQIAECVAKLEHVFARIIRCEVVVEQPHRHHHRGRLFHIRVRLTIPGGEIIASHDSGLQDKHDDCYLAVRDAFLAARRQLEDHVHRAAIPA